MLVFWSIFIYIFLCFYVSHYPLYILYLFYISLIYSLYILYISYKFFISLYILYIPHIFCISLIYSVYPLNILFCLSKSARLTPESGKSTPCANSISNAFPKSPSCINSSVYSRMTNRVFPLTRSRRVWPSTTSSKFANPLLL